MSSELEFVVEPVEDHQWESVLERANAEFWSAFVVTNNSDAAELLASHLSANRVLVGDMPGKFISQLPRELVALALHGQSLHSLPADFGDLQQLERLDLIGIQLSALPPDFGNLQKLKHLDLDGNQLSSLPAGFGKLQQLEDLDLGGNDLSSLPPDFGNLQQLQALLLNGNQLSSLPPGFGDLQKLQTLFLNGNQLSSLPPDFGKLQKLEDLDLDGNQLSSLPAGFGNLQKLKHLDLDGNQLSSLPPDFGNLQELQNLNLNGNQLSALPTDFGNLQKLELLGLKGNQLSALPTDFGNLQQLQTLYLDGNRLSALPPDFGNLQKLELLGLKGNQLPDSWTEAYEQGLKPFFAFLGSLSPDGTANRLFETKLMMVGEGRVGKSCLVEALDKGKASHKQTTHGIQVTRLSVPHPGAGQDDIPPEQDITVNFWDFGGQDVYRVTHQFFFSDRSLYIVVWNPLLGVEYANVAYWIELIQRRVGNDVRVLVVASHSEAGRVPRIDELGLQKKFPDVIAGFFEVDSICGAGIDDLRAAISREAADLSHMGDPFPPSWSKVRDDLYSSANKDTPFINWSQFQERCRHHEVPLNADKPLAVLLDRLGHIIYFADDAGLKDLVVLNAEYLSKAIGLVLEHPGTNERSGILHHEDLPHIWNDPARVERDRYEDERLYPYFLRLMEKFDVTYRINDDTGQYSLVGQLVPVDRPAVGEGPDDHPDSARSLPWDHDDDERASCKRVQLVIRLDDDPPGLMPWLIVRHHRYNERRIHWQKGIFLHSSDYGDALLEMQDRDVVITVQAQYPPTLRSIVRASVEELLKSWDGLKGRWTVRVPCQTVLEGGNRCPGTLPLTRLQERMARGEFAYPCEKCDCDQNISQLINGFPSPDPGVRVAVASQKLDEMQEQITAGFSAAKIDRHAIAKETLHELRSVVAESTRLVLKAFENKQVPCPRLFTLLPAELERREKVNPIKLFKSGTSDRYRLTLWCEMPGEEHACSPVGAAGAKSDPSKGEYLFDVPLKWVAGVAGYVSLIGKTIGVVAPIAKNVSNLAAGSDEDLKRLLKQIDVMKSLADMCKNVTVDSLRLVRGNGSNDFREIVESEQHRQFYHLLQDLDPTEIYGGLNWTLNKATGDWLWLCSRHQKVFNPDLPVIPKRKLKRIRTRKE
ncbi:leucine-rich repeat domain-containing protein [Fuerstiella marisgermanici]|uniref:non-specific serine/threonine protein kinase n=1 Tax=Fuerstiella marisgermanici TaxID=1891926 RepID=A0A1P8WJR1_9PLAN|nr:COR domain-containing protein [Fuerstiella marisgermanici]APZ94289.1 Internalin-A precursor [Fuerstiella marisgermanici]